MTLGRHARGHGRLAEPESSSGGFWNSRSQRQRRAVWSCAGSAVSKCEAVQWRGVVVGGGGRERRSLTRHGRGLEGVEAANGCGGGYLSV